MGLSLIQDSFIYHPAQEIRHTPDFLRIPYEEVTLATADGETIAGWYVPAEAPEATILFLHGNAGNRGDRINDLAGLRRMDLSILIIDYRGYGGSTGSPSEEGLHADTRAAWEHLTAGRGLDPARIVLYGESLGSVPALHLARSLEAEGRPGPVALILEGALTSALEMGRRAFPFLPVRWILRAKLDNLSAVREVSTPILFLHGERDEVAPIEMGRRLYESSASRMKEFHEVKGAWHNTLWTSGGAAVHRAIREFIRRARRAPFVAPARDVLS
ncbi:MAG TPA: alpha/beta hydrolase [Candidatus Polarisedimenticolia bacterium]|jgi:hypothetical protein